MIVALLLGAAALGTVAVVVPMLRARKAMRDAVPDTPSRGGSSGPCGPIKMIRREARGIDIFLATIDPAGLVGIPSPAQYANPPPGVFFKASRVASAADIAAYERYVQRGHALRVPPVLGECYALSFKRIDDAKAFANGTMTAATAFDLVADRIDRSREHATRSLRTLDDRRKNNGTRPAWGGTGPSNSTGFTGGRLV